MFKKRDLQFESEMITTPRTGIYSLAKLGMDIRKLPDYKEADI